MSIQVNVDCCSNVSRVHLLDKLDTKQQCSHSVTCCLQSEPDGFASFHLYVCAAFLSRFSTDLQLERDFQVRTKTFVTAVVLKRGTS